MTVWSSFVRQPVGKVARGAHLGHERGDHVARRKARLTQVGGASAQLVLGCARGRTASGDNDHDLSAWWCTEVIRRERGDRSPTQLLVLLGQFPRDDRCPF